MKTVKVRIALLINSDGHWAANGWTDMENWYDSGIDNCDDDCATARHWIEAEVPVPAADAGVIQGNATEAA